MVEISFSSLLMTDLFSALERHRATISQSTMRDVVRTAFAAIEGTVWIFRQHVVDAARSTYGLQPAEEAALAEKTFGVSDKGRISEQTRYIPMTHVIRLTARIGNRLAPSASIDFSGADWDNLRSALSIRNRITHPKSADDLRLTESDVEYCMAALTWLADETTTMMEAANLAIHDYLGELRDVMQKLSQGDAETLALYESASGKIED